MSLYIDPSNKFNEFQEILNKIEKAENNPLEVKKNIEAVKTKLHKSLIDIGSQGEGKYDTRKLEDARVYFSLMMENPFFAPVENDLFTTISDLSLHAIRDNPRSSEVLKGAISQVNDIMLKLININIKNISDMQLINRSDSLSLSRHFLEQQRDSIASTPSYSPSNSPSDYTKSLSPDLQFEKSDYDLVLDRKEFRPHYKEAQLEAQKQKFKEGEILITNEDLPPLTVLVIIKKNGKIEELKIRIEPGNAKIVGSQDIYNNLDGVIEAYKKL